MILMPAPGHPSSSTIISVTYWRAATRALVLGLYGSGQGGTEAMTTGEETDEQDELEAQLGTAMEGLQRAVVRLLQEGDVHPHLVVLALARG